VAKAVEDRNQTLTLTIHGPLGSIDLLVPPGAAAVDVAREYAAQAGLASIPLIRTRLGQLLAADVPLVDRGVVTGDVLVASTALLRPLRDSSASRPRRRPADPLTSRGRALCVAAVVAVVAGWLTATTDSAGAHAAAVAALLGGALLTVLPVRGHRHALGLAAPAFAGAAAFALVGETDQARLPLAIGMAGLAAAVAAAFAGALDDGSEGPGRVWVVGGAGLFVVTGVATAFDVHPHVTWSFLLALALLSARVVPSLAVDVPDELLLDLDRVAATAWSARERPRSGRGHFVVPETAIVAVANRGYVIVTAATTAILVAAVICAPLLLHAADLPPDRVGARVLVFLCGGGLLLSARSYRLTAPRQLLLSAGLVCWVALIWVLLPELGDELWMAVAGCAVALATLLVRVAVSTGRGWRSARWSARADVAESVCTAAALGALVVSAGIFRLVWEAMS
jgi:hypothetical protein